MFGAILGSIFSGGLTGLLGVAVQRVFDFLKVKQEIQLRKMEFDQAVEMRKLDMQMLDKEWAARTNIANIEAQSREQVAADTAFASSFAMEPKQYSERVKVGPVSGFILVLLDFLRGIVRPGLTIYLCAITTMIYLEARALIELRGSALTADQALSIHRMIVATVLYLTTTCVLWWFGTRNKQKPPGVK